jgi:hypothetical protein
LEISNKSTVQARVMMLSAFDRACYWYAVLDIFRCSIRFGFGAIMTSMQTLEISNKSMVQARVMMLSAFDSFWLAALMKKFCISVCISC